MNKATYDARDPHRRLRVMGLACALACALLVSGQPSWLTPARAAPARPGPALDTSSPGGPPRATTAARTLPNIVLITSDDQTDYEVAWMPRLRRALGRAGRTYRDALSPHPLCCPARAEILSGQYAQNNGIQHNQGPWGQHRDLGPNTLAKWFRAAGYQTAFHGKYLNGYGPADPQPRGWTFWDPISLNVYDYWNYTMRNDGEARTYNSRYLTDVLARRTNASIRRFAEDEQPFFIWTSHVAPHGAALGGRWVPPPSAPRHRELFKHVRPPSFGRPSFNEADISDQPSVIARRPKLRPSRIADEFRGRLRSLQAVDDAVASTVRKLRKTGELANTWIFYTSDNGMALGEHRYVGKNFLNREQLEIPLLVRGPGVPSGSRSSLPVTLVDLPATMVEIADLAPTAQLDGHSFLRDLRGLPMGWRDTQLVQAGTASRGTAGWAFRGVLAGPYSFGSDSRTGERYLYDHRFDPHETLNRIRRRGYRAVIDELFARLRVLRNCAGATCHQRFGPLPRVR